MALKQLYHNKFDPHTLHKGEHVPLYTEMAENNASNEPGDPITAFAILRAEATKSWICPSEFVTNLIFSLDPIVVLPLFRTSSRVRS